MNENGVHVETDPETFKGLARIFEDSVSAYTFDMSTGKGVYKFNDALAANKAQGILNECMPGDIG